MLTGAQKERILKNEVSYQTARSGGKGGQNVNKVETKVVLLFDVESSEILGELSKKTILSKYSGLVNNSFIQLVCSRHRTQRANKEEVQKKLLTLLDKLLKPAKKRIATKPSKAAREKKLQDKRLQSLKKQSRKYPR